MKKLIIFLLIAAPFVLDAQMTYVPDDNFEQALIDLELDTPPLNDSIPTKNINTITFLDVKAKFIYDLTGIEDFIALQVLNCNSNHLTSLDVSNNSALVRLDCVYNYLTSLDVSNNSALKILHCGSNSLTSLDVSKNTALTELYCNVNHITSLDVSNNSALTKLSCSSIALKSLDISKITALTVLWCSGNDLTSLDVSNLTALTWFSCQDNFIKRLDVSNNTALETLDCYDNHFLHCIQVADSTKAANNRNWEKDKNAIYSENCYYSGVDDFKFENKEVSVAPNPAQDFIEINLTGRGVNPSVNDDVKIYNFLGEIVFDDYVTPPGPLSRGGVIRIDLSGVAAGVYFIRMGNVVRKFIKT